MSFVKTGVRDSRLEIRKTNGFMMYFTITNPRVSVFSEGVAEDSLTTFCEGRNEKGKVKSVK